MYTSTVVVLRFFYGGISKFQKRKFSILARQKIHDLKAIGRRVGGTSVRMSAKCNGVDTFPMSNYYHSKMIVRSEEHNLFAVSYNIRMH